MKTSTKHLLGRVIALPDEHAFEDLYRHYFVRLYRFCFSIIHLKEPAEEIIHDVFMNLWKKRLTLGEIDNLDVYLYVAVKNLSLNYLRDNHFPPTVDIEQSCNNYIQFHADPEALLVSAEVVRAVLAAIDQLPPRCKLIFKLIKEDGLKYKEVAELLGLSVKTVEAQLAIALKKIAAVLKMQEAG
ncbi:MAG TPA: RNA polymerase sigma-70 factor [Puia sp.]|nr:RNA polymerase sigma-70 factor [Puia sp.]